MSQIRKPGSSRRKMLWQTAAASGLGAIFKMTEGSAAAQAPAAAPAQGRGGAAAPGRGGAPGAGGAAGGRGGGGGRGGAMTLPPVSKLSAPSDLRITGMRSLRVAANFDYPIIRIDTNQGVYGLGEVRDGGSENSALAMKPFLIGRNPLDFDNLMSLVLPYAGAGRVGGGYSAIDIALNDIIGKVYGIPVWRLLGTKKRTRVRLYADTTGTADPKVYAERMLARKKLGFTFLKMDVTVNWISGNGNTGAVDPNTGVPTDKGLAYGAALIQAVRDAVGWEIPLSVDSSSLRCGSVPDGIRAGRAFEKFNLAWLEDLFGTGGFNRWKDFKAIKANTTTKLTTGEDAFGLEAPFGFKQLIDNRCIDVVHADHGTSGGCRLTKRIADYAWNEQEIPTAIHMAGSPLATMAAVHTAATMEQFVAMELHAVDFISWWQDLITGVPQPVFDNGYITVPDAPGLGIELNEAVVKEHLRYPGYFDPNWKWDATLPTGGPWPHFDVDGKWVNERSSNY
jgi:L-alanine-DL-glutamate epimerase-like enolase superfamily enzyme